MSISRHSPLAGASGLGEPLTAVEELLRQQIGLDVSTVGSDRIAQAVGVRRARRGLDLAGYLLLLLDDEEELRALVDEVVVPETWFFRDRQAFRCLRRQASRERMGQAGSLPHARPFRALSIPCCTGEEPYSIAMLLLDTGLGAGDFEVVGVDVSAAALATAAAGSYADLSFRETEAEFVALRDRYCRRDGQRCIVTPEVRGAVRFLQANLAALRFLDGEPRFHAIFCRNLFIYLEEQARRTALAHLRRLLLPGGALYLSAVEAGALSDPGLRRLGEEFPFVFTPVAAPPVVSRSPDLDTGPTAGLARLRKRSAVGPVADLSSHPRERETINQPSPTHSEGSADLLTKARQAADAGRLEEAAALCAELADKGPPRAEVFYLLGVVRQAQSDFAEAERCFQRALYLNPRHAEALLHLALLARGRGDERLAENFLRRAGRTTDGD